MHAQIAQFERVIVELGGSVGTNLEARPTAHTLILVDQGDAHLDVFVNSGMRTGRNTGRVNAVHAKDRLEILVDLIIKYMGPNLMNPNQRRSFRIAKWGMDWMRWQVMLQFARHDTGIATNALVLLNENGPVHLRILHLVHPTEQCPECS
jgi:hypothetical protein